MTDAPFTLLSPKYDFVFKQLFGDANHTAPLEAFLQAALGLPAGEFAGLAVGNPNLNREFEDDKLCILDVRIKTISGRAIDVEIQLKPTPELQDRIQAYTARMVAGQVKAGESYEGMPQSVCILIADFRMWGDARYHHRFRLYDREAALEYPNSMEIHTLELPKIPQRSDGTALWNWLKFISSGTPEEFASLAREDAVMAEAYAKLVELSADEEARWRQESREKWEWDQAALRRQYLREGRAEGKAEGDAEASARIVHRMLQKNVPFAEIAEWTGCPLPEIERLSKERKFHT